MEMGHSIVGGRGRSEGMNLKADPKIVIRIKCNNYWKGFSIASQVPLTSIEDGPGHVDGQRPNGQVIANRLPELEGNKLLPNEVLK